jgi:hypothetical protein
MAKLTPEEMWERMLTGDFPRLTRMRRIWGALPSPLRCKLCNAPFRGPGGVLMRAIAYGPSPLNRLDEWDGIVDKFVGDGAVALLIAGSDHAAGAIAAAGLTRADRQRRA